MYYAQRSNCQRRCKDRPPGREVMTVKSRLFILLSLAAFAVVGLHAAPMAADSVAISQHAAPPQSDFWTLLLVFILATFIGVGVIQRVSRLLHTPLMSITNAISAIAVVGSILVVGSDYPDEIRVLGAV